MDHLATIWQRLRRRRGARMLAAAAMAVSIFGVPGLSSVAQTLPPTRPGDLPEVLASVTVLSETAMSKENAAGLQPTQIIGQDTGHARVMLWDELKASPQTWPNANGTVTLTPGGGK